MQDGMVGVAEAIVWLAILIVMVVIEIKTLGLTTIWFAGGALVALLMSLLGIGLPIQILLFLVVSLGLLLGTRPIALKYFNKNRTRTNAESLLGSEAIVLEPIDNIKATGRVQASGQEWMARSADDQPIAAGAKVRVEEIRGVKLIVRENGGNI